jgi:hypothetical protein
MFIPYGIERHHIVQLNITNHLGTNTLIKSIKSFLFKCRDHFDVQENICLFGTQNFIAVFTKIHHCDVS